MNPVVAVLGRSNASYYEADRQLMDMLQQGTVNLPHLKRLELLDSKMTSDEAFPALANSAVSRITTLRLFNSNFRDSARFASFLENFTSLRQLRLKSMRFSNDSMFPSSRLKHPLNGCRVDLVDNGIAVTRWIGGLSAHVSSIGFHASIDDLDATEWLARDGPIEKIVSLSLGYYKGSFPYDYSPIREFPPPISHTSDSNPIQLKTEYPKCMRLCRG